MTTRCTERIVGHKDQAVKFKIGFDVYQACARRSNRDTMRLDMGTKKSFCIVDEMGLLRSLIFFGVPGLLMALGVGKLVPVLLSANWPLIVAYPLAVWAPVIILLVAVFVCFFSTRTGETAFASRFRFNRLSGKTWLIIVGGFIVVQALELVLSPTRRILAGFPPFSVPPTTPELFHPLLRIEDGLTTFFGVAVEGNWWLVVFWLGWLIVNIGAEEILWRGYALPLQEKVFGKWAWLVNGLSWNLLVHMFMPWSFISLIPTTLIVPYLVQRFQNTWIGIVIHGAGNVLVFVLLIPAIAGV